MLDFFRKIGRFFARLFSAETAAKLEAGLKAIEPYLEVAVAVVTALESQALTSAQKRESALEALQSQFPTAPIRHLYRVVEVAVGAVKP